ncbi:MAG: hypothetical protein K2P45_07855 [Eubacterium sp.]|nr:hypothetical protein [Eubacterium sp.]
MIKEDLLFVFQRLFEKNKITLEEYSKAVTIISNSSVRSLHPAAKTVRT